MRGTPEASVDCFDSPEFHAEWDRFVDGSVHAVGGGKSEPRWNGARKRLRDEDGNVVGIAPWVNGSGTVSEHVKALRTHDTVAVPYELEIRRQLGHHQEPDPITVEQLNDIHDVGEVGFRDLDHGTKSASEELEERTSFRRWASLAPKSIQDRLLELEPLIFDDPLSTVEGRYYKALDVADHVRVGTNIYQSEVLRPGYEHGERGEDVERPDLICWDILRRNLPTIIERSDEFPSLYPFFRDHRETLLAMLDRFLLDEQQNEWFVAEMKRVWPKRPGDDPTDVTLRGLKMRLFLEALPEHPFEFEDYRYAPNLLRLAGPDTRSTVYHNFKERHLVQPGQLEKRWKPAIEPGEEIPEDGRVDNHSHRQARVVLDLIRDEEAHGHQFTFSEKMDLAATGLYHDLSELLTKDGDVAWTMKISAHEEDERKAFRSFIEHQVPPGLRRRLERVYELSHDPVGKQSELGLFFAMSEVVGYVNTAVEVFEQQSIERWDELAWGVTWNQMSRLTNYAERYPSIRDFFARHETSLRSMMALHQDQERFRNHKAANPKLDNVTWEHFLAHSNATRAEFDRILGYGTEYTNLPELDEELAA